MCYNRQTIKQLNLCYLQFIANFLNGRIFYKNILYIEHIKYECFLITHQSSDKKFKSQ